MLRASGTPNRHSWPLALDKSIPLDQWSVWIWTLQTSGTPNCHSWPIVYPYTHNISCLTMTSHESLGPYMHSYVSIANVHKPKTMQVIALMESQDLYFNQKIFGSIKIKVSLCTLAILQYTYLIHILHANIHSQYIYLIHTFYPCIYIYIYIYITCIHSMALYIHPYTYLIHI